MQESAKTGKSGVGAGSASVVLIFAVLCLTIFTLITYIVAGNQKTLVDAETALVTGFYEADALAERILAEIMSSDILPDSAYGIDIQTGYDEQLETETVFFYCPVTSDSQGEAPMKSLYVSLVITGDSYSILSWRMTDTDVWVADSGINIWGG